MQAGCTFSFSRRFFWPLVQRASSTCRMLRRAQETLTAQVDDASQRPSGPVVSVIVANYNGAAYLRDCVVSIQKQTLRNIEIIVSDDASTDNSREIVAELMREDPRIKLLQNDRNFGPAAARNRALKVAKGEWIAIVDGDNLIHASRLDTLVKLAMGKGLDVIADNVAYFDTNPSAPSGQLLNGRWADGSFTVKICDYIRLNRMYTSGPILGYLKPVLRASILQLGKIHYDETLRIAEDYYLILHLLHAGRTMQVHPVPLYYYRRHEKSISHRLNEDNLLALKAASERFRSSVSAEDHALRAAYDFYCGFGRYSVSVWENTCGTQSRTMGRSNRHGSIVAALPAVTTPSYFRALPSTPSDLRQEPAAFVKTFRIDNRPFVVGFG